MIIDRDYELKQLMQKLEIAMDFAMKSDSLRIRLDILTANDIYTVLHEFEVLEKRLGEENKKNKNKTSVG